VRGVWNVAAVFGKAMIARGHGYLCLTASEHSFGFQHGGAGIYTASKHAVYGLAEVLRTELPEAVGLSVLFPGLAATEIYDSARYDTSPRPDPFKPVRRAVIEAGMPAEEVARATLEGVARGDFLIVTHAHSRVAADRRYQEIVAAFEAQAPMTPDAGRYDVVKIAAQVRARMNVPPGIRSK
jgi:short-subunit dehydrogenase